MKKLYFYLYIILIGILVLTSCTSDISPVEEKEKERIIIDLGPTLYDQSVLMALDELKSLEEYKNIEFVIREDDPDYWTKMPLSIANGDQIDVISVANVIYRTTFVENSTIIPLDGYIKEMEYDFESMFGDRVSNATVGDQIYIVPQRRTTWALYYNKDLFDEAGIPYLDQKIPITWNEYENLAKKLTKYDGEEKIYGALHMSWPIFWYGEALQNIPGKDDYYNSLGLSNIDHPEFKKSLERSYRMMHEAGSIPTYSDLVISKSTIHVFMNGHYGMLLSGSWVLNWAMDKDTYPRDWKLGIAPIPSNESGVLKSWGDTSGFGVPPTSGNAKLAVEIALKLGELSAKYALTNAPSHKLVETPMLYVDVEESLLEDGITVEMLEYIQDNSETEMSIEKVSGIKNVIYDTIIKEEAELYFVNEQDIDTTISNMKKRIDEEILN